MPSQAADTESTEAYIASGSSSDHLENREIYRKTTEVIKQKRDQCQSRSLMNETVNFKQRKGKEHQQVKYFIIKKKSNLIFFFKLLIFFFHF